MAATKQHEAHRMPSVHDAHQEMQCSVNKYLIISDFRPQYDQGLMFSVSFFSGSFSKGGSWNSGMR
jgi:hypothetical protein